MGNYVGNDAQNTFTLSATGISDVAWSTDEKTIYATTLDGKIKVFDVATHALLNTWSVGKSLGAISLSDDGKTLVAGGVTAAGDSAVFAIDTATGAKTAFKPAAAGVGDIEIVDNQHVLVGGNGSGQILTLDLATGKFAATGGLAPYSPNVTFTEDQHLTLVADGSISNGPLYLYDDRTGTVVAAGDNYQSGVGSGFNFGVQAVSEAAGLVLQFNYYSGVNIYDLTIKAIKEVALGDGPAEGYSFAADGKSVYVFFISGEIGQYRVSDWQKLASFTAPAAEWFSGAYGNMLHASSDGDYLSVVSGKGYYENNTTLTLIDLTSRNEVFKGTAGADTFAGGLGNDTYTVNHIGDIITENANGGNDKVLASVSYTLAANVETLQLVGSAAINGTGNAQDNTLIGNAGVNTLDGGKGADRLVGSGGGDTLIGGLGNDELVSGKGIDTLTGGAGNDTYIVNDVGDAIQEDAGSGVDTVQSAMDFVLTGNLENLVLVGKAVTGIGNALANTITGTLAANTLEGRDGNDKLFGLAGSDVLNGGDGNDVLDGGTGGDTMTGGVGSDMFYVDNGRDVINEIIPDAGTDTVIAAISWKLGLGVENLTLAPGSGAINGTGNELTNVLIGNAANNRLDGGLGVDRMSGGLGDDTYAVDNKSDRTTEAFGEGTDTVLSGLTWKLAANVENLTLTGKTTINGTGNQLANVITGNAGDNVLDGGGVDDGLSVDTLIGGKGNDTYIVDQSYFFRFDIIEQASEGTDRVVSNTSYDALAANVENLVLTGSNNLSGGGNALANVITGNSGNNLLQGYDGNDTLTGGAGNDGLYGGKGDDTLDGGDGDDGLYGNAGTNTLRGGAGSDIYYVGEGTDTIVEKADEGVRDIVFSSISFTLPTNVEIIQLTGDAAINALGNAQDNILFGNAAVNFLNGLGGNDILADLGGNDTLTGGAGADSFQFISILTGATSTIIDFSRADGDKINLQLIDANAFTFGDEAFTFIGTAAFSGNFGDLRYNQSGGDTYLTGDVNGDKVADFEIRLTGLVTLTADDLVL